VTEDGKLDKVIKPQKSKKQRQAASEQIHKLDEKDQVWERYKNMHIAEVLGGLIEEIKILKDDQEQLKKIGNQEEI
jgi:head-tail adaptor